jgi:hypothetical protein
MKTRLPKHIMAAKQDAPSISTKIYNKLEELEKKMDEWAKNGAMMNTEMIKKLSVIETKQAAAGTTKPRSGGKAGGANSTANVSNKKLFAKNTLVWMKEIWNANRDETSKKFFTDEQMGTLAKYMETEAKVKDKQGEARGYAEVGYLWETYIDTDGDLMKKIRKEYDASKDSFAANNKNPVAKEDADE